MISQTIHVKATAYKAKKYPISGKGGELVA